MKVLDAGFVELLDTFGDDLTVVNAARVSFHKEVAEMKEAKELAEVTLLYNPHICKEHSHRLMQLQMIQWNELIMQLANLKSMNGEISKLQSAVEHIAQSKNVAEQAVKTATQLQSSFDFVSDSTYSNIEELFSVFQKLFQLDNFLHFLQKINLLAYF
jgi:hypothetical protein